MIMHDATRGLASVVIEADRRPAVRCSPSRCVGAWALKRLPGVLDARVGAGIATVLRRSGWTRYELERNTKAATAAYDNEGQLLPVGFVFRLIPPSKPLGSRQGTKPGSGRRSGAGVSVATRQPSRRHIDLEPT